MKAFTNHRNSTDSNFLYPDIIKIDDDIVQYSKCAVIEYSNTIISRHSIADVTMNAELFFADVIITNYGGKQIIAREFSKKNEKNSGITNKITLLQKCIN